MTKAILQWANGVRIVGNDAAHDLKMEITKTDAKDTLDFTEAVLLYVFVLQSRFSEFQNAGKKQKRVVDSQPYKPTIAPSPGLWPKDSS